MLLFLIPIFLRLNYYRQFY